MFDGVQLLEVVQRAGLVLEESATVPAFRAVQDVVRKKTTRATTGVFVARRTGGAGGNRIRPGYCND